MHQYRYLNSKGNEEHYNYQVSMSSLYVQPQITKADGMNDLKIPENWSCRFYPVGSDSPANYTAFNPQSPPFSLDQPIHYAGMMPQGHLAALLSPPAKAFKFSNNNGVIFGNSPGWGGQVSPMGWGNNGGYGQPGMLGNLLTVGKGTMNGIGMLSSLMGMGKFFF
ncbi:hypothetical protein [Bacillus cereus]|uniref:hypothetical protein n=1 Tax=Bacillus cereus TaxID=1396 RepID=UPI00097896C5|nr:hypothetical protein [Bacillus cereus]ONG98134.1 hypothetical protein BKK45_15435 [Bacillus cereus]